LVILVITTFLNYHLSDENPSANVSRQLATKPSLSGYFGHVSTHN